MIAERAHAPHEALEREITGQSGTTATFVGASSAVHGCSFRRAEVATNADKNPAARH